jgi:hypothetical protein
MISYLEAIGYLLYGELPMIIFLFGILLFSVTLGILSQQCHYKNSPKTF